MTTIKPGDFVRTGLGDVGVVVSVDEEENMAVIEDWEGETFRAVLDQCRVVGETI